ncbi:MAG: DUF3276 family protein [Spirosomataceae bacterium]
MHRDEKDKIYSKRVRAGKRTYFFDVRSTRANDFYLTITESRRFQKEGDFVFEKSKMFIYKEDFHKFVTALQETLDYIKEDLMPEYDFEQIDQSSATEHQTNQDSDDSFTGETSLKWD